MSMMKDKKQFYSRNFVLKIVPSYIYTLRKTYFYRSIWNSFSENQLLCILLAIMCYRKRVLFLVAKSALINKFVALTPLTKLFKNLQIAIKN